MGTTLDGATLDFGRLFLSRSRFLWSFFNFSGLFLGFSRLFIGSIFRSCFGRTLLAIITFGHGFLLDICLSWHDVHLSSCGVLLGKFDKAHGTHIIEHLVDIFCDGAKVGPDGAHHFGKEDDSLVGDFEGANAGDHIIAQVFVIVVGHELAVNVVHGPFFGHLVENKSNVWAQFFYRVGH